MTIIPIINQNDIKAQTNNKVLALCMSVKFHKLETKKNKKVKQQYCAF